MTSKARCFTGHPNLSTAEEGQIHSEMRLLLDLWMMHHEDLSTAYEDFKEAFELLTEEDLKHPNFDKAWRRLEAATLLAKGRMHWYELTSAELGKHDPYCHLATIH